jgi:hypothetical protein
MPLKKAQRATLAAHVIANQDPAVIAARTGPGRNDTELTRIYNLPSTFIVWKESMTPEEYRDVLVWTEIDALTNSKARIWEWLTQNMTINLDMSKASTRQGITDAFGAGTATRLALIAAAKIPATLAESIFANGTGTDATPGKRTFSGLITTEDMGRALNEEV